MICPMCATHVALETETCPSCSTGLAEYASVAYLPTWLTNQALVRLRREQWGEAATLFSQAALYAPRDLDLLRGWAHALVQMGQLEEALDKASQALELVTDSSDDAGATQAQFDQIVALMSPPEPAEPTNDPPKAELAPRAGTEDRPPDEAMASAQRRRYKYRITVTRLRRPTDS